MQVKSSGVRSEINVTPLVDVVLVLLIIFLVITPLLQRGVPIDLPGTAHHASQQDNGEQLVLSVRTDGVYIGQDKIGDAPAPIKGYALGGKFEVEVRTDSSEAAGQAKLLARLQSEIKGSARPVHIRADRSLPFHTVRYVLEAAHAAGATQVGMATQDLVEGKK